MTVDLVLKGGRIVTSRGILEAEIAVEQGKIVAIAKETHKHRADRVLNVSGLFVLPGLIDAHVHSCDPGFIRESFRTGTQAAAVGGVTTIIDMASSVELRTSTVAKFERKKEVGEKEAFVDFGLYGGEIADEKDLQEVGELVNVGVMGFGELMMCGDSPVRDDGILSQAFRLVSEAKSLAAIHAEDNAVIKHCRERLVDKGRTDITAFADARPNLAEQKAIRKAISLAEKARCRLHICHLSTSEGVGLVRNAKVRGLKLTTEVCPHHLFLTREAYKKLGPYVVTTPPLRRKQDLEALWGGLRDGTIDLVVSDHCAFSKAEKDVGRKDVWSTPPGVPGLETLALMMLGMGVRQDRISLERFVEVCGELPAKVLGLFPKKGIVGLGSDADLLVVDLHARHKITADDLRCVADYTPFEGWTVDAKHVLTLVRGEVVAKEGEVVGKMGFGKFVRPLSG